MKINFRISSPKVGLADRQIWPCVMRRRGTFTHLEYLDPSALFQAPAWKRGDDELGGFADRDARRGKASVPNLHALLHGAMQIGLTETWG